MLHKNYVRSSLFCRHRLGKTDRSRQGYCSLKSIGIILGVVALFGAMTVQAAGPAVKDVTYPANMFDNGKARHFEYKTSDGVTIKYFIMKSSDGIIRAAFDACDVCWREGKGYVQQDDVMVCRNCGRRFPSTKINVVTGGCNPGPLTRNIEGGKVVIKVEHILEGKRYFALRGGR